MKLKSLFFAMIVVIAFAISITAQSTGTNNSHAPNITPPPAEEPKNSISLTFQEVTDYHGGVVGDIFQKGHAPRVIGRYTRTTGAGNFYGESWNSFGKGFHQEADLGVGWQKWGWDVSFTRFFVRGGDIDQTSIGKSGAVKIKGKTVGVGANLFLYSKANDKKSPPGGAVFKTWASFSHLLPKVTERLSIRHNFAIGVDNNPFGLGHGVSTIAHYNIGAALQAFGGEFYGGLQTSNAIIGRENTSRRFRKSASISWSRNFNW